MLSRVAERIYWQSRYLERAEDTARLLNVISNLLLDLPPGTRLGWRALVEINGTELQFDERYKQSSERNVAKFMIAEKNGVSLVDILSSCRENARTTRDVLPTEAFEQINELYHFVRDHASPNLGRAARHDLLEALILRCQQISGLMAGTMSRDDAYSFVRLGRALERADMTTRILDVGARNLVTSLPADDDTPEAIEPYENILWMNILRALSAYQMYRQHVRERVGGKDVVEFLLRDKQFPRTTLHNLETISKVLVKLPRSAKVRGRVDALHERVGKLNVNLLLTRGTLLRQLDELQKRIGTIHDEVAKTWFLHHS